MALDSIVTSVSLGLLSASSPCILPLYPGFLAYLSGAQEATGNRRGRYFLGFFVLAGVLSMMLVLGLFIALISVSVGQALAVAIPLADVLIIGLGVLLLLNINPSAKTSRKSRISLRGRLVRLNRPRTRPNPGC